MQRGRSRCRRRRIQYRPGNELFRQVPAVVAARSLIHAVLDVMVAMLIELGIPEANRLEDVLAKS